MTKEAQKWSGLTLHRFKGIHLYQVSCLELSKCNLQTSMVLSYHESHYR